MLERKQAALIKILITSEHGGNEIPVAYADDFAKAGEVLESHRGYDPGSLDLFEHLKSLSDFNLGSVHSRLLIELNRSLHHRNLFSEFTKTLSASHKQTLINEFYFPYRKTVENWIEKQVDAGFEVWHFSIHTFTPVLHGETRKTDVGLLYDPKRSVEKDLCKRFSYAIKKKNPDLKIRMNYPYLGISDGFTAFLRKQHVKAYAGIELEVNQKFVVNNTMDPMVKDAIYSAMHSCIV